MRNLLKSTKEEEIRQLVNDTVEHFKKSKFYRHKKLLKQVKLLFNSKETDKNGQLKSKCIAFVELIDLNIAKYVIDKLNNHKIREDKGLILDFALDDARRVHKREVRLKQKNEAGKKKKVARQMVEKVNVADCSDVEKLKGMYEMTVSRGKRQRIKKKLNRLGFNGVLESKVNEIALKNKEKKVDSEYVVETVDPSMLGKKRRK